MAKITKTRKAVAEKITPGKAYPAEEALKLVKECAKGKFVESVDVAINLGIDASKSDQVVRGSTVLPNDNTVSPRRSTRYLWKFHRGRSPVFVPSDA